MKEYLYLITPFCAWLVCGSLKFLINTIKYRKIDFTRIGYGGMPSNHSAIVFSMVAQIALIEGIAHPAFGAAITFAFIVVLDAGGLRKHVEKNARVLNSIQSEHKLRNKIGHSKLEVIAGAVTGSLVSTSLFVLFG